MCGPPPHTRRSRTILPGNSQTESKVTTEPCKDQRNGQKRSADREPQNTCGARATMAIRNGVRSEWLANDPAAWAPPPSKPETVTFAVAFFLFFATHDLDPFRCSCKVLAIAFSFLKLFTFVCLLYRLVVRFALCKACWKFQFSVWSYGHQADFFDVVRQRREKEGGEGVVWWMVRVFCVVFYRVLSFSPLCAPWLPGFISALIWYISDTRTSSDRWVCLSCVDFGYEGRCALPCSLIRSVLVSLAGVETSRWTVCWCS